VFFFSFGKKSERKKCESLFRSASFLSFSLSLSLCFFPLLLPPPFRLENSPAHQLLRHRVNRVANRLEVRTLLPEDLADRLDDRALLDGARRDSRQQRGVQEVVARGDDREVDLLGLGLRQGLDKAHGPPPGAQDDDARADGGGRARGGRRAVVDGGVDGQRLVDRRQDVRLPLSFSVSVFVFVFRGF